RQGGLTLLDIGAPSRAPGSSTAPVIQAGIRSELGMGLEEFDIDVGLPIAGEEVPRFRADRDYALHVGLVSRADPIKNREAADYIEKYLRVAGEKLLKTRLTAVGVSQRPVPIAVRRHSIEEAATPTGTLSIAAVVPFILILMTVTGAVYPAIDLTAGERER